MEQCCNAPRVFVREWKHFQRNFSFRYKWLDRVLPGTAKKTIVKKLLLDQFLMTPPLLGLFFTGMSIMEMQEDPLEECRNKFLPTFARSCLFWLPAQTVNFLLVPPALRVTYIGTCSLIWANILCFVKRQKTDDKKEDWRILHWNEFR